MSNKQLINIILSYLYWKVIEENCQYKKAKKTDADPNKIIFVEIDSIKYESPWINRQKVDQGQVIGGYWDKSLKRYEQSSYHYKGFYQHFIENKSWENTIYYREVVKKRDIEYAKKKCKNIEILYKKIKDEGYKTQKQLNNDIFQSSDLHDTKNNRDEITVAIGRDGTLFRVCGGKHRTAMAKVLDISPIPVQVLIRHQQWQMIRDEIKKTDNFQALSSVAKKHIDHPDLYDIIPESWSQFETDAHQPPRS